MQRLAGGPGTPTPRHGRAGVTLLVTADGHPRERHAMFDATMESNRFPLAATKRSEDGRKEEPARREGQLVSSAAGGDLEAFNELIARTQDLVYSVARS